MLLRYTHKYTKMYEIQSTNLPLDSVLYTRPCFSFSNIVKGNMFVSGDASRYKFVYMDMVEMDMDCHKKLNYRDSACL